MGQAPGEAQGRHGKQQQPDALVESVVPELVGPQGLIDHIESERDLQQQEAGDRPVEGSSQRAVGARQIHSVSIPDACTHN